EIDALPPNGEPAGYEAEQRGNHRAADDRKLRRPSPRLRRIGGDIAGPAEEQRMPERSQADIANQQIEGAGEQSKAQRLHQKDRMDHERQDHEQHDHGQEGGAEAPAALAALGKQRRLQRAFHHALRPNNPAGLIKSTIAMMTKITVFEASG